jgi:hypothetical protein
MIKAGGSEGGAKETLQGSRSRCSMSAAPGNDWRARALGTLAFGLHATFPIAHARRRAITGFSHSPIAVPFFWLCTPLSTLPSCTGSGINCRRCPVAADTHCSVHPGNRPAGHQARERCPRFWQGGQHRRHVLRLAEVVGQRRADGKYTILACCHGSGINPDHDPLAHADCGLYLPCQTLCRDTGCLA